VNARRLTLLLVLYVGLDLANPFMPGAFNFDPDESFEGVHVQIHVIRPQFAVVSSAPSARPALDRRSTTPTSGRPDKILREWRVDLRQSHDAPSAPPPPGEDH
jgi:hypothetical protein